MRLIDEKGRIFGKINVIDFLLILFLLSFTPMLYFGHKLLTKKPVVEVPVVAPKQFKEIEIDCKFIGLKTAELKIISANDQELDEKGQVIGEVISFGVSEPYRAYEFDITKGEKKAKELSDLYQLKAKFRFSVEVKENKLYYKGKLIKTGLPFQFKTAKYNLDVVVLPPKEELTVAVRVKFQNLMPEIAKVVKIGDKQLEITEDNNEKPISKIVKVISNEYTEFVSQQGELIANPKYRDLVLEIETLCFRNPKGLFVQGKPVKIGKPFYFATDLYSMTGIIIGIEVK